MSFSRGLMRMTRLSAASAASTYTQTLQRAGSIATKMPFNYTSECGWTPSRGDS